MNLQKGFLKWIILIIIALVVLGYLGFDVRKAIEAPTTQTNFSYVEGGVVYVWNNYLSIPASYLWNDVFIKLIWSTAIENLTKIKNGQPTNYETLPPNLPVASPTH